MARPSRRTAACSPHAQPWTGRDQCGHGFEAFWPARVAHWMDRGHWGYCPRLLVDQRLHLALSSRYQRLPGDGGATPSRPIDRPEPRNSGGEPASRRSMVRVKCGHRDLGPAAWRPAGACKIRGRNAVFSNDGYTRRGPLRNAGPRVGIRLRRPSQDWRRTAAGYFRGRTSADGCILTNNHAGTGGSRHGLNNDESRNACDGHCNAN